jgi:cyanate permease
LVGLGATTYGMLATFVKKWHILKIIQQQEQLYYTRNHRNTAYDLFQKKKNKNTAKGILTHISAMQLELLLGMTSVFYYLAVKYIPVLQESCY